MQAAGSGAAGLKGKPTGRGVLHLDVVLLTLDDDDLFSIKGPAGGVLFIHFLASVHNSEAVSVMCVIFDLRSGGLTG
jgi:hypothetical protein